MPYATAEDLGKRLALELLILLADEDGDGAPDEGVVTAALSDASAEIDQALSGRYATPVAGALPILKRWCADLAAEHLFLRQREAVAPEYAARAELVRRSLNAVEGGIVGLAGAAPMLGDFAAENTRRGETATFTRETLGEF